MQWTKACKVITGTKWRWGHRASPGRNVYSETNCMRWHDNVGIENCGINVVTTNWLHGEFGCKFRFLDCVKNASFTAQRFVFRKTSSGLAHEPNGCVFGLFAAGCGKKRVVWEAGHCAEAPVNVMGFTLSVVLPR
jgi:hypothetical protein